MVKVCLFEGWAVRCAPLYLTNYTKICFRMTSSEIVARFLQKIWRAKTFSSMLWIKDWRDNEPKDTNTFSLQKEESKMIRESSNFSAKMIKYYLFFLNWVNIFFKFFYNFCKIKLLNVWQFFCNNPNLKDEGNGKNND